MGGWRSPLQHKDKGKMTLTFFTSLTFVSLMSQKISCTPHSGVDIIEIQILEKKNQTEYVGVLGAIIT